MVSDDCHSGCGDAYVFGSTSFSRLFLGIGTAVDLTFTFGFVVGLSRIAINLIGDTQTVQ
jgi:hypothetical protein